MVDPAATDAIEARVRQVNEKRTMTSIVDSQLPVVIDPDVAMTLQEPFCAASQVSSVIGSQESSVIQLHEPSVVESREPSVVMSRESIVVEPQELIAVESWGSSEVESWGSNVVESQGSSVVESQGSNVAESRGSSVDEPCLSSIVESWGSSVAESRRTIVVESQTRDVVEWGKDLCLFRQEAAEESDDEEFCDTIDQVTLSALIFITLCSLSPSHPPTLCSSRWSAVDTVSGRYALFLLLTLLLSVPHDGVLWILCQDAMLSFSFSPSYFLFFTMECCGYCVRTLCSLSPSHPPTLYSSRWSAVDTVSGRYALFLLLTLLLSVLHDGVLWILCQDAMLSFSFSPSYFLFITMECCGYCVRTLCSLPPASLHHNE